LYIKILEEKFMKKQKIAQKFIGVMLAAVMLFALVPVIPAAAIVDLSATKAGRIVIDGVRDDIYSGPYEIASHYQNSAGTNDMNSATGKVWTAWDNNALYFYFEIYDATPNHTNDGRNDNIGIYIDWNNVKAAGGGGELSEEYWTTGDYSTSIMGTSGPDYPYWQVTIPAARDMDGWQDLGGAFWFGLGEVFWNPFEIEDATTFVTRSIDGNWQNGYIVEARILAPDYVTLHEGKQIPIDFEINDNIHGAGIINGRAYLADSEYNNTQWCIPSSCTGLLTLASGGEAVVEVPDIQEQTDISDITIKELASGLEYDYIYNFSEGLAAVSINLNPDFYWTNNFVFIDKAGNEVISKINHNTGNSSPSSPPRPPIYGSVGSGGWISSVLSNFDNGVAFVATGDSGARDAFYGFIDKEGNAVSTFNNYWMACYAGEGMAWVYQRAEDDNWLYGYIDSTGTVVVPIIYDDAGGFNEGLAPVSKDGKYGYVDKAGNEILPFIYDRASSFNESLAAVGIGNWTDGFKWGYIDKSGKEIMPLIYDDAKKFSEGLAPVKKDGKWGYIDKSGKEVIPFEYDSAEYFADGAAVVGKDGKYGHIDKTGKIIVPLKYGYAYDFNNGLAGVRNGDWETGYKYGYVDKTGREVFPVVYEQATDFREGIISVKKDGTWSIYEIILPDVPANPITTASDWAVSEITSAIEKGLVPENLQGNYQNKVTRGEVAQMFINLIEQASGKAIDDFMKEKGVSINADTFVDTKDKAVLAANALGIIFGVGDGKFDPDGYLRRAQIAAIINRVARVLGIDTDGYTHKFTDVIGHWSDAELGWPVHAGIIKGVSDVSFAPDSELTTEQAIAITYRALAPLSE
jgi:hypothetical protein